MSEVRSLAVSERSSHLPEVFMQLPEMSLLPEPMHWEKSVDPRASSVLALFVEDPTHGVSLLFTRRSMALKSHAGQVGFPGGRREVWDVSPSQTALREAMEEISLPSSEVTILGALPTLKALDGKAVIPIVAYSPIDITRLVPSPDEVAEIFVVPWNELTVAKKRTMRFNIFGRWRETPHYEALGHHVWGLTAWMIDRMKLNPRD